jgi:uncharacterized protein (DUF488 family)
VVHDKQARHAPERGPLPLGPASGLRTIGRTIGQAAQGETVLRTIGHSTHEPSAFVALLRRAAVDLVVDVRSVPASRRHPHVAAERLASWLPEAGVRYRVEPRLGGFRRAPPASPDRALRTPGFRGYAHHMRSEPFELAVRALIEEAASVSLAVMCAEGLWWRCHRRLLADWLVLVGGVEVLHVMPNGTIASHRITDGVRRSGNLLVYDAGQGRLLEPPDG